MVHCTGWLVEQPQEGAGVVVQPQEWLVGGLWSEHKLKPLFNKEGLTCDTCGEKFTLLLEAVCVSGVVALSVIDTS